ncbi:CorA family divalent cation transporter [bacterium]|nr:CorA family divalent cation transporter [bacterium]
MEISVNDLKNKIPSFSELYIEDFLDLDHPSSYVIEEDYEVLIIRQISLESEGLKLKSRGYIIYDDEVYRFKNYSANFEHFKNKYISLHNELDIVYDKNYNVIDKYIKEIDRLEDNLYDRKLSKIFMDVWFDVRKDLASAERFYARNLSILNSFFKRKKEIETFPSSEFQDLTNFIHESYSIISNQLNRLDGLHHYYTSIKSDRLNSNIYFLAIISAIFLPLNLIVGFFGVNTGGLYFQTDEAGTSKVLIVLLLSLVTSLLFFPTVKFIDNYLIKLFLGKGHFYNQYLKFRSKK